MKNAPLQEVVFEVKWDLDRGPDDNIEYDEGYDLAIGVLKSILQEEFPIVKSKFPPDVPTAFKNYKTTHQYRIGEKQWPVLQLGPGIFTVNDTEDNYKWENHFYPLIIKGLNWLEKSYGKKLHYNFAGLRYIDRISTKDYEFSNWLDFINDNLNFEIRNPVNKRGELKQFSFVQVFELKDNSNLQLAIKNGKNENKEDVLVWETAVLKIDSFEKNELNEWLNKSHEVTSELFKELCKDDLYNSFK